MDQISNSKSRNLLCNQAFFPRQPEGWCLGQLPVIYGASSSKAAASERQLFSSFPALQSSTNYAEQSASSFPPKPKAPVHQGTKLFSHLLFPVILSGSHSAAFRKVTDRTAALFDSRENGSAKELALKASRQTSALYMCVCLCTKPFTCLTIDQGLHGLHLHVAFTLH